MSTRKVHMHKKMHLITMKSVTKHSIEQRNSTKCVAQLLTPMQMNFQNTPSHKACFYGNYTTLFLELKLSGSLPHMEALKLRVRSLKHTCRYRMIKQAIHQYDTYKCLRNLLEPTRDFMRIVVVKDNIFDTTNSFDWVNIKFLRSCVRCLIHQLKFVDLYHKNVAFECPVQSTTLRGYADVYDRKTKTVIEIKTCRFLQKEHFVQAKAYQQLLGAKKCYLMNCVDGAIWKL